LKPPEDAGPDGTLVLIFDGKPYRFDVAKGLKAGPQPVGDTGRQLNVTEYGPGINRHGHASRPAPAPYVMFTPTGAGGPPGPAGRLLARAGPRLRRGPRPRRQGRLPAPAPAVVPPARLPLRPGQPQRPAPARHRLRRQALLPLVYQQGRRRRPEGG